MREEGIVVRLRGRLAVVRVGGRNCGNCRACPAGRGQDFEVEVWNTLGVLPGERVALRLDARVSGIAGLIVFGLPLLAGATGFVWFGATGAVFFFLASFLVVGFYDRRLGRGTTWRLSKRFWD